MILHIKNIWISARIPLMGPTCIFGIQLSLNQNEISKRTLEYSASNGRRLLVMFSEMPINGVQLSFLMHWMFQLRNYVHDRCKTSFVWMDILSCTKMNLKINLARIFFLNRLIPNTWKTCFVSLTCKSFAEIQMLLMCAWLTKSPC